VNFKNSIESVSALEFGQIQVVAVRTFLDGDNTLGETRNVYQILPGDNFENQDQRVQNVCRVIHTPEVIAQFRSQLNHRAGAERQRIRISRMTGLEQGV
jgi:hypothetical protein